MNKNRITALILSLATFVTFAGCSANNKQEPGTSAVNLDTGALTLVTGEQTTASFVAVTCEASDISAGIPTILSDGPADTTACASSGEPAKRGGLRYTPGVGTLADEPDVMTPRKANNVGQIVGTLYDGQAVNPNFYYYRCMLNDNGKSAYDTIHAGLLSGATSIKLSVPLSTDSVDIVYYSVLYDDPQIVWAEPGYSYSYNNSGNVISISPIYNSLANNISGAKKALENSVSKALAVMWALPNNIERSKYAHDYLTHTIDYVEGELDQNAYSALVQHKTVCAGYSQAYAYMMQKMGAPCAVLIGDSGGPHAWNIVMLDGESYVTDVTWDDPYENPPDTYYYDYFNLTSRQMSQDHTLESPSTYLAPAYGTKASYNNYFGGNAYGTDFDSPVVIDTTPVTSVTTRPPVTTTKPPATTTRTDAATTKPVTFPYDWEDYWNDDWWDEYDIDWHTTTATQPPVTTTKPPVTTTKPVATTTKPAVTTTKPPVTTTKPPATTTRPPVNTTKPVTEPDDWDSYWNDDWWDEYGIDTSGHGGSYWDYSNDYDDWDIDLSGYDYGGDYGYDGYDHGHSGWYEDYYYHNTSSDEWWSYLDPYWKKSDWTDEGDGLWSINDRETGYMYIYDEEDGSFYCVDRRGRIYWYDESTDDWFELEE